MFRDCETIAFTLDLRDRSLTAFSVLLAPPAGDRTPCEASRLSSRLQQRIPLPGTEPEGSLDRLEVQPRTSPRRRKRHGDQSPNFHVDQATLGGETNDFFERLLSGANVCPGDIKGCELLQDFQ